MTTATTSTVISRAVTGTAEITLRAVDPIHHGAGTSGNTALARMQDSITPDGQRARTPYVSGASIRHTIRDALAWLTVEHAGIEDRSLPKAAIDLLWSGGALTATGAQTDLAAMTERHRLLPSLPLMGYSLGSDLVRGSLRGSNAHLACPENTWRIPATAAALPAAGIRAVEWVGDEFGTRHDTTGGPTDRLIEDAAWPATNQMIFEAQVIRPGSIWCFTIGVDAATPGEVDALAAALQHASRGGMWHLGAKAGQGWGRCLITAADFSAITGDLPAAAERHIQHLTANAPAIRDLLRGAA